MSMPKGSLQRAPWCCGLLVVQHGAGVEIACVAGYICMSGIGRVGLNEGGADMLCHLEAGIAPDVCVKAGVATRAALAAMTCCAEDAYPARRARRLQMRNCELSTPTVQSSLTWTLKM